MSLLIFTLTILVIYAIVSIRSKINKAVNENKFEEKE